MANYREAYFRAHPAVLGKYTCCKCKKRFKKEDIDVDHIISKRLGGTDDLYNLQALCKHCNRSKRERTSGGEVAKTLIGAGLNGIQKDGVQGVISNFTGLGSSMAKQKLKDALGLKYKRK